MSPLIDEYGFVNKFACSRDTYMAFKERYRVSKAAMEQRWKRLCTLKTTKGTLLSERALSAAAGTEYIFQPFSPTVKKAIRLGIPSHLRPAAWFFYSGGEALRNRHGNPTAYYESLLMQPKPAAFYLLTDRMKMDFVDILPTNQVVRRDYFSSSNTMMNNGLGSEDTAAGRVCVIPDCAETLEFVNRPRRLSTFAHEPPEVLPIRIPSTPPVSSGSPSYHAQHATVPFLTRLHNILVAFFMHRTGVEYCRSVCTMAASLLLVIQDEEKTFWTLSALFSNYVAPEETTIEEESPVVFTDFRITDDNESEDKGDLCRAARPPNAGTFKYFPDSLFRDTATCSYASLDGFKGILARKRPQLMSHMRKLEIPVGLIATTWFQSLYLDVLPTETSMRVMDAFVAEGFKVLYRVALALFMMNEQEIMQKVKSNSKANAPSVSSDAGSQVSMSMSVSVSSSAINVPSAVLNLIKQLPKRQVDADALLSYAFCEVGSLPMAMVREECDAAASQETPLRTIRRFSQAPEMQLTMSTVRRLSAAMDKHAHAHGNGNGNGPSHASRLR